MTIVIRLSLTSLSTILVLSCPSHVHLISLILLVTPSLVLTGLSALTLQSSLGLWGIVLSVFREPHCDAFVGTAKLISNSVVHGKFSRFLILVVHKCNPLPVLIPCESHLNKARQLRKDSLQLFLCHICWYVAHIEGHQPLL